MKIINKVLAIFFALLLTSNFASSAEKWDMALAYGASNFHSANATEFAKNVSDKSGGKLSIVTHPGGSLYKGGEIFRAVRTGQAQIGERFMSALGKEDPLLEIDSQPFLASSYDDAMKAFIQSKLDYLILDKKIDYEKFKKDLIIGFVKENTIGSVNMMIGLEQLDMEEVKKMYYDFLKNNDEL